MMQSQKPASGSVPQESQAIVSLIFLDFHLATTFFKSQQRFSMEFKPGDCDSYGKILQNWHLLATHIHPIAWHHALITAVIIALTMQQIQTFGKMSRPIQNDFIHEVIFDGYLIVMLLMHLFTPIMNSTTVTQLTTSRCVNYTQFAGGAPCGPILCKLTCFMTQIGTHTLPVAHVFCQLFVSFT